MNPQTLGLCYMDLSIFEGQIRSYSKDSWTKCDMQRKWRIHQFRDQCCDSAIIQLRNCEGMQQNMRVSHSKVLRSAATYETRRIHMYECQAKLISGLLAVICSLWPAVCREKNTGFLGVGWLSKQIDTVCTSVFMQKKGTGEGDACILLGGAMNAAYTSIKPKSGKQRNRSPETSFGNGEALAAYALTRGSGRS